MKLKLLVLLNVYGLSFASGMQVSDDDLLSNILRSSRRRSAKRQQVNEVKLQSVVTIAPTVPELERMRSIIGLLKKSLGNPDPQTITECIEQNTVLLNALAEDIIQVIDDARKNENLINELKEQVIHVDEKLSDAIALLNKMLAGNN